MINPGIPSLLYLWPKRTLYIGPLFEPVAMTNGAASLAIGLNGPLNVFVNEDQRTVECSSFLIPPGVSFTADAGDTIVANCMLDALGYDYAALYKEMRSPGNDAKRDVSFSIKDEEVYRETYLEIYQNQYDSLEASTRLEALLTPPERLAKLNHRVDERVVKVIDLIKQNIDKNLSIKTLAEAVNLSVPRLIQVFKAQTGVPIRRYRKWHRLYVTSALMSTSSSLTEASIKAGFADGVHFAHTFQKMLGMRASLLLSQPNQIRITTDDHEVDYRAHT
ncbi:MAG: hypothetical protein C9356_15565 [Oleiphilus sp.]|nr:MAG: hypothetical protein C9356_15565 [Oleiphilus sp.]